MQNKKMETPACHKTATLAFRCCFSKNFAELRGTSRDFNWHPWWVNEIWGFCLWVSWCHVWFTGGATDMWRFVPECCALLWNKSAPPRVCWVSKALDDVPRASRVHLGMWLGNPEFMVGHCEWPANSGNFTISETILDAQWKVQEKCSLRNSKLVLTDGIRKRFKPEENFSFESLMFSTSIL